ncbi:Serine/threonine-protein kinase MRCK gamma like [Melia azedarach]|uniref:Serine/threonine-protein kinase MRCK gamma like n=1 Tax=Melia azedarach TaxID=155640 RepID=A0ACC1YQU1_MELAZ|nr:Serine/threonine-protein kinase MRCK gamma like [Melia azedarach]
MKFLLELVWCCGCHGSCSGANTFPERPSDRNSLVPVVRRSNRRRRRGRNGVGDGGGGGRADEWTPSLCSISEDSVVVLEKEKSQKTEAERVVKRKSGGFNRDRVRVRSYSKDFGKNSPIPTFIPAFSPTPFMF